MRRSYSRMVTGHQARWSIICHGDMACCLLKYQLRRREAILVNTCQPICRHHARCATYAINDAMTDWLTDDRPMSERAFNAYTQDNTWRQTDGQREPAVRRSVCRWFRRFNQHSLPAMLPTNTSYSTAVLHWLAHSMSCCCLTELTVSQWQTLQ